jgi:hypothetical protein
VSNRGKGRRYDQFMQNKIDRSFAVRAHVRPEDEVNLEDRKERNNSFAASCPRVAIF